MSTDWSDDDILAAELAAALQEADDVPARVVEAGRDAFTWRVVDAELAELLDTTQAAVGARATATAATAFTFIASRLTIELEVTPGGLTGQLVSSDPGSGVDARVEGRERGRDPRRVEVDRLGLFRVRPGPSALFQLCVTTGDGRVVLTPWTQL